MKKTVNYYELPEQYWQRIHFVRPRYKGDIENVLLYMANECCKIKTCSCKNYARQYFAAIRMYPGNIDKSIKTLNNWRTETPALFGFYVEDKEHDVTKTSKMAYFLNEHQDLTQFMRLFLLTFQFPGGHIKSNELYELIKKNVRFKPAQYILQVLCEGNLILSQKQSTKEMSISAEEATYCIFNDLRVLTGERKPSEVATIILENRLKHIKYYNKSDRKIYSSKGVPMTKGDVIRYAGDILDYMAVANLLNSDNGYYYMKGNEKETIEKFIQDKSFFMGYERFYQNRDFLLSEITEVEPLWYEYINESMSEDLFKTDVRQILNSGEIDVVVGESHTDTELSAIVHNRIREVINNESSTTKDIGNLGESLICGHEKMRLKLNGYEQFVKLVQIVDGPAYHPGYDIDSYEADGTENHRYIEVKTTISKQQVKMLGFHMSPNEWSVASTIKEHYCVYRLMLSEKNRILYILRNPVDLYKKDIIDAMPRDGMEISFIDSTFKQTPLLQWAN